MSYRPKIKTNTSGGLTDFPLDAETVKGVDVVTTKQDLLVDSGVNQNIKTLNGNSILGSGDLTITAVASDEKARKLLGEWDTYPYNSDTSKVLRETGYAIFDGSDDENWQNWDADQYRIEVPNCFNGNGGFAISNRYPTTTNWNNQRQIGIFDAGGNVSYQIFIRDNNYDLTTFKESLRTNPLIVQYKTNTSYVDNVIPSGQILNLDVKGCNFVKEEYEKTLNLLDYDNRLTGKSLSNTGEIRDNANTFVYPFVRVKPNTTYRIYGKHDFWILHYTESQSVIGDSNTEVFTTESNCYYLRTDCYNQYTECMLIEDIGARIPYQKHYGKIIHEKDVNIVANELKNLIDNNWGNYQGRKESGSINDYIAPGYYQITDSVSGQPITSTYGKLFVYPWGYETTYYMTQVYITQPDVSANDRIFIRGRLDNGNWTSWREIITSNGGSITGALNIMNMSFQRQDEIDNVTGGDLYIGSRLAGNVNIGIPGTHNCNLKVTGNLITSSKGIFSNGGDNSVIEAKSTSSNGYANIDIYNTNSSQKWTIGRQGTDGRFYIGYNNGSSWNDAQFQIDTAVGKAYLNGLQLVTSKRVKIEDTTGYTAGWFRVAKISPNGSFIGGYIQCTLLIIGNWSYEKNTNAEISISAVHTSIKATQVCGEIGDLTAIRFVPVNTDNYYVDVYLSSTGSNTRGAREFTFIGNVAVTDMNAQGNSPLSSSDSPTYQMDLVYGISTNEIRAKDMYYGDTGYGIKMKSLNTGAWKEGLRIYQASNNYSLLALVNNDSADYVTALVSNSASNQAYLERKTPNGQFVMHLPEKAGTLALTSDIQNLTLYRHIVEIYKSSSTYKYVFTFYNTSANDITYNDLVDLYTGNGSNYSISGGLIARATNVTTGVAIMGTNGNNNDLRVEYVLGTSSGYDIIYSSSWSIVDNVDEV